MSWGCAEIMSESAESFASKKINILTVSTHNPQSFAKISRENIFSPSLLYLFSSLSYFLRNLAVKKFRWSLQQFFCTLKQLNVEKNKIQIAKSDAK